jgi:two-component system sensor kinase FixL
MSGARAEGNDQSQRVAEARWRAVIDAAVDGIIVIDERGRIEVFNPAAQRMFEYGEADVIGQNVSMLMPEPDHSRHDGYLKHHLDTGEKRIIGIGREVTGRRHDGTTFPLHLSVGEMEIDGRLHFTGILHDLSRRHELEDRLREATAMARIGEMAAVIAHEVKNPLAAVRGAIQVIGGRLPAGSGDGAIVKEIIARLDGLNDLIQDLLVFARPPKPKLAPTDLHRLLAGVAGLLKRDPALAGIDVTIDGTLEPLQADANLLTIVFQNLVINAAQAMQGRGVITVTIAAVDTWQRVEVTDRGPGIPAEIKAALFRPFKTTKARGTGLGMATAKRLVELHGGRIAVESPDGGGTTVTVDLPVGG